MRKILKKISALTVVAAMCTTLFACGGGNGQNNDGENRELDTEAVVNFALGAAWDTLNYYNSTGGSYAYLVADKIFDKLIYVDENYNIEPRAAKSWELEGDVLTFHLDENATWHDGEPVTAKDWLFTLQYVSTSETTIVNRSIASDIQGTTESGIEESENSIKVEAPDDYTLVIHLKEQYNMESFFMTSVRTLIVLPEHILGGMTDAEIATSDFWENPIGSGPCKFVSQIAGSELILETFDDYHLGSPQFSKLVFKVVSMSNYANVMMAGEADILYTAMDTESALSLEGTDGITVTKQSAPSTLQALAFNCNSISKNMRQAINLCIDKQTIIDNFYSGQGELVETVILPGSEYYYDKEDKGQDIEKAKEYVAAAIEAGEWSEDRVFEIGVSNDSRKSQAELIVQWLAEAGIKAKVSSYDASTMWANMMMDKLDSCMMSWMPSNDPLSYAGNYEPENSRLIHVSNEEFSTIIDKIQVEQDLETRKEQVKEFIELEYEECPISWICAQYAFAVTSSRLEADPFASDMFNNAVWEWKVYK